MHKQNPISCSFKFIQSKTTSHHPHSSLLCLSISISLCINSRASCLVSLHQPLYPPPVFNNIVARETFFIPPVFSLLAQNKAKVLMMNDLGEPHPQNKTHRKLQIRRTFIWGALRTVIQETQIWVKLKECSGKKKESGAHWGKSHKASLT